jgi:hypothetical protein
MVEDQKEFWVLAFTVREFGLHRRQRILCNVGKNLIFRTYFTLLDGNR